MKKMLIVCCSALVALAVMADEPAPPAAGDAPKAPRAERGHRGGPRMQPLMLRVTDKTTDEELAAFKRKVAEKIDARYAEYKAKAAPEGQEKPPLNISLLMMERRPGMGPGARGQGPRGQGPRGPKGARGPRRGDAGDRPGPEGDKPAPEAD